MSLSRLLLVSLFTAALGPVLAAGCAPSPRNVPCSNASDCEAAGNEFRYCVTSRCVECLDDASCGDGNRCDDGICERRCRDDRECRKGERCQDHVCTEG